MPSPRSACTRGGFLVFTVLISSSLAAPTAEDLEFFEKKVRPVLAQRCYKCHGPKKQEAGLRVDSRAGLVTGGDSGPAIVPGNPEEGFLVDAVNYGEVYQMPPDGKLQPQEIAALTRWVKIGAPWPGGGAVANVAKKEFNLKERARHWSFQPMKESQPPAVKRADWPRGDLDRFILARLDAAGLSPTGPADARTLVRRLYLALTGLPPSPKAVEKWVRRLTAGRQVSEDGLGELVDELLASPQFGERWARHWLDLMRYAESRGHEFDYDAPNAFQYRDYVIRAFNADVPYNDFVIEHLAGDLLAEPRLNPQEGFNESILGTGFWFLGEWVHSPVDVRLDEAERFDNMLDVMSKTFLGLTVACARCHDHKFDAISQRDYYALQGYLQSSAYRQARFDTIAHNGRVAEKLWEHRRQASKTIAKAVANARRPGVENLGQYLLAAREAVLSGLKTVGKPAVKLDEPSLRKVEQLAKRRSLEAERLARLTVYLMDKAANDTNDPLYLWAQVAHDRKPAGVVSRHVGHVARQAAELNGRAEAALKDHQLIIDYSRGDAGEFFQDGFSFGPGPQKTGTPLLGEDANQPVVAVATYGAVRKDTAIRGLKLAQGTKKDPGRLGGWVRSGRTFRTPTFTISSPQVYYLVKGPGRAYAAVDSHRMNQGPLHGSFPKSFKVDRGRPQWIAHDLRMYLGHRAHLEFSPEGDQPLEVLMVVQGDRPPGDPLARPNRLLLEAISSENARQSPEALAAAYQACFQSTRRLLAGDAIRGDAAASDHARLADWIVRHGELLGGRKTSAENDVAAVAKPLFAERQAIVSGIKPVSRTAPAMWDGSGEDEILFIRGNHKTPGKIVPRRFLEALSGTTRPARITSGRGVPSHSGRLALACAMTDPQTNPFIARVIVNRVWHYLFGRGIVASVDNFGVLGERPTHPALLDHLAAQFVRSDENGFGWSIKRLIREIVLSQTYRMSSREREEGRSISEQIDPDNRLLHRFPIRRLEGEAIRDAILAISGRLDGKMFGPSVGVYLTPFMQGRGRPRGGPLDGAGRRSIYISVRRNFLSPMMLAFDVPQPFTAIGRRTVSNVPAQALIMMNDPFVVQQAGLWARRLLARPDAAPRQRIESMYQAAFSRPPSDEERAAALAFLENQARELGLGKDAWRNDPRVWSDLCHVLFNVKEFVFIR